MRNDMRKFSFCLFNVYNITILSCHEQMCLMSLYFERYFFHHLVEVTLEMGVCELDESECE